MTVTIVCELLIKNYGNCTNTLKMINELYPNIDISLFHNFLRWKECNNSNQYQQYSKSMIMKHGGTCPHVFILYIKRNHTY